VTADNGEFVTAETGDHIIRPQYVAHSARRLPQHGVAARMTEDVVHLLEPIQIKTDDCKLLVASPRPLQPRSQLLIQGGSIGNPGQRIMVYKIAYASFSSLSLADITYRVDAPSAALVESFPHRDFNGDSRLVSRDQVHFIRLGGELGEPVSVFGRDKRNELPVVQLFASETNESHKAGIRLIDGAILTYDEPLGRRIEKLA
jgi:hypothetical protein